MSKDVTMFVLDGCPYCREAYRIMDALKAENPAYKDVNVKIIEETKQPEIANAYDYEYVPTYFIGNKKIHEGVPSVEAVQRVYEEALTE